jgi:WD40 repeat protein
MIASGSKDGTVRVWSVPGGQPLLNLRGHGEEVRSVAFSPDGKILASGSEDETARLWEIPSGKPLLTLTPESSAAWVTFSPDGNTLITGLGNGLIKLWWVGRG